MGASQSAPAPAEDDSSRGFHVLRLVDNSPAALAGIEVFFDFIISIAVGVDATPRRLENEQDSDVFADALASCRAQSVPLVLHVFNANTKTVRQVTCYLPATIPPTTTWRGRDISSSPASMKDISVPLGVSIRFCDFGHFDEQVFHVLDVKPGSPAESARLRAHTDWIVATKFMTLRSQGDFMELIQRHVGKPLQLFVYNNVSNNIREVVVVPKYWGGRGLLGADIGYGAVHKIVPPTLKQVVEKQVVEDQMNKTHEDADHAQPSRAPFARFSPSSYVEQERPAVLHENEKL